MDTLGIYLQKISREQTSRCCFFNVSYNHEERAVMLAVIKTR